MLHLNVYSTLVMATLVLLLGRKLVQWIPLFSKYTIPEPVVGGLCVALVLLIVYQSMGWQIAFDPTLREPLMLSFFATVGLSANLARLKSGGRVLAIFIVAVVGLLFVQNLVGVGLATLFGLDPLLGLIAGSITLSGGHGTGAAWGEVFAQKYGFHNAIELAMACATFGLMLGGIVGGPVARYLIKRSPTPEGLPDDQASPSSFEKPLAERRITSRMLLEAISMIAICLMVGSYLAGWLKGSAFELPTFVCVMFTGVVLGNSLSLFKLNQTSERSIAILGNISLSLFLSMALMSLKLWEMAPLALPMFFILMVQTAVMILYAITVTYRLMGKNYDAAVLCAGHCGFGLGATPTAIANMQAITGRFGPSHVAFMVVPLAGAFFVDIANVLVIKLFLWLPIF